MRRLIRTAVLGGCVIGVPLSSAPAQESAVAALATEYVDAFFAANPEEFTENGITGSRHDGLRDNSLAALAGWQHREDVWLSRVRAIDGAALAGPLTGPRTASCGPSSRAGSHNGRVGTSCGS